MILPETRMILPEIRDLLLRLRGDPPIVAIDGRGSSGKSTLARRLCRITPGSAVVHTDDIAWAHAVLDWTDLLIDGVIRPVRAGARVAYRPPKWDERGRAGAITVPVGLSLLLIEGVGSGRRSLAPLLDGVIWVETPLEVHRPAHRRPGRGGRDHRGRLRRLDGRGAAVRRAGTHLGTGAADDRRPQPARR